ncbi:ABC transporter ATP-binding protein [Mycobacterium sp. TY814]|uniref:ABC transporter ATP-binding protein n=1 Tax=unclassified Mycobacterium TaxID=2642494 RepID=UPI0027419254|nr:ABC transporter ATP-binding protein [Mycobacterium sp. TY814]MDP7726275.1 ABC transporter ATP-binding protein [Mycobacterium sp. TY814]
MLTLLRPHWVSITMSMTLLCAATALILWQPLLVGRLVDNVTAGALNVPAALTVLVILVCQLALEGLGHFRLDRTGEKIVLRLRAEFTDHVVRLPIGLLDRGRTGELLARGASDAGQLRDMPRAVGDIAFGILTLLGASVLMLSIDALTLCVVVGIMTVAFGAGSPFLSRIQRDSLNRQVALGDYTAGLDRVLGAARTVKLFGAEDREVNFIGLSAAAAYRAGVRVASSTAINILAIRLGVTASFLTIMVIDGRRVAGGGLSVGHFVSLFAFAMYAVFPITAGFAALATFRTAAGAYQHLVATLRDLPEGDPPAPSESAAATTRPDRAAAPLVEFDHVSFSYGPGASVLDDVSFTLRRDEITALVGPSGAGKSTILALLCRFHDPDAGTVRWEGEDIRTMPLRDLRGRLGLLEQDAPVLHGTIRDNLLIADPGAADEDLWRVLRQASIADEIAGLPEQLDTPVLERGRSLSGGQRQRLALARALLSRSELILMDEPTSHLDRANEYDIMANLLHARGRRSILVVAHRLSTVTNAGQILVLQQGRIQATGTHAELMCTPVYRELVEHELVRH